MHVFACVFVKMTTCPCGTSLDIRKAFTAHRLPSCRSPWAEKRALWLKAPVTANRFHAPPSPFLTLPHLPFGSPSSPLRQLSTSCLILICRWRLNGGWFQSSSNLQRVTKRLRPKAPLRAGRLIKRWERSCSSPTRATSVLLQKGRSALDANKTHNVYLKGRRVGLPLWRGCGVRYGRLLLWDSP